MAWTAPPTFSDGSVLTGAQLNILRDDLNQTAAAKATTGGRIFVATGANAIAERAITGAALVSAETTTSTSYTALATSGPAATVTSGTKAIVFVTAGLANDGAGGRSLAAFAIGGATISPADDINAIIYDESGANRIVRASAASLVTGLTSGSNVFTMQYRVGGGTGSFSNRHIFVIPL